MCRWGCGGLNTTFMCKWCGTRYCKECLKGEFTGCMFDDGKCRKCNQKNCQGVKVEFVINQPDADDQKANKKGDKADSKSRSRSKSPAKSGSKSSKKTSGKSASGKSGKKAGKKKGGGKKKKKKK